MSRTTVFQGVELTIPGAYSYLDLSRLLTPVSGGVGIVALVGESEGGKPGFHLFAGGTSSSVVKSQLRGGPGADGARLALRSGVDPLVQAGASTVLFYKTNNSTQSNADVGFTTPAVAQVEQITCVADLVARAEQTDITCVADVLGSLDGTYFTIPSALGNVAFWIDETGTTPEPSHGAPYSVKITGIASGDADTVVAGIVKDVINNDSQFSAIIVSGAQIRVTDAAVGPRAGAAAGTSGFTVLQFVAGQLANSLDGKYFITHDKDGSVAVWYNVTGSTPEPLHGADRSIEINTVVAGDGDTTVASKTSVIINADLQFNTVPTGANIALTNAVAGARLAPIAGTSGFSVSITTPGSGVLNPKGVLTTKQYGTFTKNYLASIITSGGKAKVTVTSDEGTIEEAKNLGELEYFRVQRTSGVGTVATGEFHYIGADLVFKTTVDAATELAIVATGMNIRQLVAEINKDSRYTATYNTAYSELLVTELDYIVAPVDVKNAPILFKASQYELENWAENQSLLVDYVRSAGDAGDTLVGTNQSTISFSGGTRGTTSNSDVQNAYNELLKFRVNITVPLFSSDNQDGSTVTIESVNAIVKDHVVNRSSLLGKSECQAYVSIAGSKADFKAACAAMNSRWVAVTSQKVRETDILGVTRDMPEWAFAVVCAQTQAGSPIGTPLTNRIIPSLGITQHVSWSPNTDAVEMIKAGALIAGTDENNNLQIIAGYTSWTGDTNNGNIYIETVESLAIFAFNHRQFMKAKFGGQSRYTIQSILSAIDSSVRAEMQNTGSIKGWDSKQTLLQETTGGVLRYELAVIPWEGIVFILPTIIAIREA